MGKLPCIPISQSVTAFGRQMIEITKEVCLRWGGSFADNELRL
ncbi:MAG: hypothetical protein K2Z81_07365 [Cyanobacteria bacterium]|nr:hypothetical protein [Cyanobacteriota bacterium]